MCFVFLIVVKVFKDNFFRGMEQEGIGLGGLLFLIESLFFFFSLIVFTFYLKRSCYV